MSGTDSNGSRLGTEFLISIGLKKTPASILSALFTEDGLTIKQLVEATNLPKGSVVSGLRYWRFEGWVTSEEGNISKSGRQPHLWFLAFSREEVLHRLQSMVQREQFLMQEALRDLMRWKELHDGEI